MKKRIFSLLLCIVMVLSLLPTVAFAAATEYDVWVNGEQFTSEKLTITCGTGTATYDPNTQTLTLDGAQITKYISDEANNIAIKAEKALNVVVNGNCSINSDGIFGIVANGNLLLTGPGNLDIITETGYVAIDVIGDLVLNMDGNLYLKAYLEGIWNDGNVTISGNGGVTIEASYGIVASNFTNEKHSVTISGTGDVTIKSKNMGIEAVNGDLVLSGSGKLEIASEKKCIDLSGANNTMQMNGTGPVSLQGNFDEEKITGTNLANYDKVVNSTTGEVAYLSAYDVWVDNMQVTAANKGNVLSDGKVSYNPATQTLTLNGAAITQTHEGPSFSGAIYAENNLTVNVTGDSSIILSQSTTGDGIYAAGDLTITGDKALNIKIQNEYGNAVWVNGGDLTVDMKGALAADCAGTALSATGDIAISGDGSRTISAAADAKGIYSSGGDISLSGSGDVTIDAGYGIYAQTGDVTISGDGNDVTIDADFGIYAQWGSVTISGSGNVTTTDLNESSYGILADKDIVLDNSGKVTVTATKPKGQGIVGSAVTLSGSGDVTVNANYYGLNAFNGDFTISGDSKVTVNTDDTGIYVPKGSVTVSGSGAKNITSAKTSGISSNNKVTLTGEGDIVISAGNRGIWAASDITINNEGSVTVNATDDGISSNEGSIAFSGSGEATVSSTNGSAVVLWASGKEMLLNGTGEPITLTGMQEAVYNVDDTTSPVAGTNFDAYVCVEGAADEASVVYRLAHSFGSYVSDNNATCLDDGTKTATCGRCGATDTVTDPGTALGHSWGAWTSVSSSKHQRVCSNDAFHIETADHTFSGRACADCGYIKSSVVPVTPVKPVLPFIDVKTSDWSYDDIYYVWENGLMNGVSDTLFAPQTNTSRAMIVTILWRLEGEPIVNYAMSFKDVAPDQWYTEAIRWAQATGIVNGYNEKTFGINDPITREQMAAILYRYCKYKGYDVSFDENTNFLSYTDFQYTSEYAMPAMMWAIDNDILQGSNYVLNPQGNATREQVAAILHRFCEKTAK